MRDRDSLNAWVVKSQDPRSVLSPHSLITWRDKDRGVMCARKKKEKEEEQWREREDPFVQTGI